MDNKSQFAGRLPEEAREMMEEADKRGLAVRLMGGIGLRLLLGSRLDPAFQRQSGDIDVITVRRDGTALGELLAERGWQPSTTFNALNRSRRMLFLDPESEAQVDVFVATFEMCHKLPLADRLDQAGPSLPASDLLMTKLQIVELNEKDRTDCYALLWGCEIGPEVPTSINLERITRLTSQDWGLHHTFELNLERLRDGAARGGMAPTQRDVITSRIEAIEGAMSEAPKSRGWGLRARIGERKRWYELPEEVDRDPVMT